MGALIALGLHTGKHRYSDMSSLVFMVLFQDNCDLERKVIYTFNARWANEFYKDRVALAGDALHLMPPFIGQGLNSGFRDAAALAWRLPLMISELGDPRTLLKTYQTERMEHLRKLTVRWIYYKQSTKVEI